MVSLVLFFGVGPLAIAVLLQSTYSSRIEYTVADVPVTKVGIVFGASVTDSGVSDAVEERLQAAADLYKQGKIQKLIVSGDNQTVQYNEPQQMIDRAVQLGIAVGDIQPDYGGRRTYDTCYRAKYIFGLTDVILISQPLHLARALYICNSLGLRANGYAAQINSVHYNEDWFRELLAFVKAIWDVNIAPPQDVVMGDPIVIK